MRSLDVPGHPCTCKTPAQTVPDDRHSPSRDSNCGTLHGACPECGGYWPGPGPYCMGRAWAFNLPADVVASALADNPNPRSGRIRVVGDDLTIAEHSATEYAMVFDRAPDADTVAALHALIPDGSTVIETDWLQISPRYYAHAKVC